MRTVVSYLLGTGAHLASAASLVGATFLIAAPAQAATITASSAGPLVVTVGTGTGPATAAEPLAMGLIVANTGPDPIGLLTVGVRVPAGVKLTPFTAGTHICSRGATSFLCDIGILRPGLQINWTFQVTSSTAGTMDVQGFATATFPTLLPTPSSTADVLVPVNPGATVVQVSGSASTGSPLAGSAVSYRFQVKNSGRQPAYGVAFSNRLPTGEALLGAATSTGTPCALLGNTVSCGLGDLAVGARTTVTVSAMAPVAAGSYMPTATVSSTNSETQPANNTASVPILVK